MIVHAAELPEIRELVRPGDVTDRGEQRILNHRAEQHVRAEAGRPLGGLPEQRPHRIPLLADDEGAVLLANGAAAPVQMKERQAVVLRVDLRMVAARRQIGSGQRRELRGLPRHRQLAREDAARQRLGGWIR